MTTKAESDPPAASGTVTVPADANVIWRRITDLDGIGSRNPETRSARWKKEADHDQERSFVGTTATAFSDGRPRAALPTVSQGRHSPFMSPCSACQSPTGATNFTPTPRMVAQSPRAPGTGEVADPGRGPGPPAFRIDRDRINATSMRHLSASRTRLTVE